MEIKIERSVLDTLLSKVYPIVPSKSTLPALANILLEARDGKIYASATDLETSATAIGTAEIVKEGELAINGKNLFNLTRELPQATLKFKVDNLLAEIQCEKGKFTMTGVGKDEFPKLLELEKVKKITIPYTDLQRAIDKTLFACATGEMSGVLGGILLDIRQNEFRLVATDGHKLAMFKKQAELDKVARLLVASKVWQQVTKFSSGIDVAFEENKIGFYSEDMSITARLMEGDFPPYEGVIPKDNDKLLVVAKSLLIDTLRRALVFTSDISKLIKFRLKPNTLVVEASSETGESKEELECKYDAPELEIAYNGNYLLSILARIDSDDVQFLFKNPLSAAIIEPAEEEGASTPGEEEITYLLMPIRLE